jgi:hypothetical protein
MRRGGARREVTERVTLRNEERRAFDGWALNVSRGGLRAILEEHVSLGQKFEITLGVDETIVRSGRIVWLQEEPDGVIVGIEFTGLSAIHPSVPPAPLGAETAPRDETSVDASPEAAAPDDPGTPSP